MIKREHQPMVYSLYGELKANHRGKENKIYKTDLAKKLGISERYLRSLTERINDSHQLEGIVSTVGACYLCNTKEECERTIRNTYNVALALFRKAKNMERKVGLNNQIRIKLGDELTDIVSTFEK